MPAFDNELVRQRLTSILQSTEDLSPEDILAALIEGDSISCTCCGKAARMYKRKLNKGMASVLIRFIQTPSSDEEGWVHIHKVFSGSAQDSRDWPLLRHWGLLEQMPPGRSQTQNSTGYWRVTPKGTRFVQGAEDVPSHVLTYNNHFIAAATDSTVSFTQALGRPFSYGELMATLGS